MSSLARLTPIEPHVRVDAVVSGASVVVRGWPLTVEGLLRNAASTRDRYSLRGRPLVAVSVELADDARPLDAVLSGARMRTRTRYAVASVGAVAEAGFQMLPTFAEPHWSIVLPAYTPSDAQALLTVLGPTRTNPYFERRRT